MAQISDLQTSIDLLNGSVTALDVTVTAAVDKLGSHIDPASLDAVNAGIQSAAAAIAALNTKLTPAVG